MTKHVFDILTILPRDEIKSKGIPYVRDIIDAEYDNNEDKKKWDFFWNKYFVKFWMSSAKYVETWNINDDERNYKELQNRTNNALERYNRTMNEKFPVPHPSLKEFVTNLEKEGRDQAIRLENIRRGTTKAPNYKDLTLDEIPDFYIAFKP